jgi:hypothetical protein
MRSTPPVKRKRNKPTPAPIHVPANADPRAVRWLQALLRAGEKANGKKG